MSTNTQKPSALQLDLVLDLQKWQAFLAIAELGSLKRAAVYLNVNPSQLSRQLNALERNCKDRLFVRTGRGVALSDLGLRLFPQVKSLLVQAQSLDAEIHTQAQEPSGRVILGSLPSITHPIVGLLYSRLRENYPKVQLKILEGSSGQIEEWLSDGRVDIAILYRYHKSTDARYQYLATVDSYLVAAKGDQLTAAPTVKFSQLNGLPFILPGIPNGLRTTLDLLAKQERITLHTEIEADSLPLMRSVVAEAKIYTVLPLHAVWAELENTTLQASKIVNPTVERYVSMELAQNKLNSRAIAVVMSEIIKIMNEGLRKGLWNSGP